MKVRLVPIPCPTCGAMVDAATDPTDDSLRPVPGDFSICLYCQDIHVFEEVPDNNSELDLREATVEELLTLPIDLVSRYQRAIKRLKESDLWKKS